jgi:hypothetical protein
MLLAVAPALMTVVPSGAVVPGGNPSGSVLAAITAASRYAAAHGVSATAAVRDTRTEVTYAGPRSGQYFGSASVVKVFVATELLLTGQMHGRVARQASRMIEASDNDAYRALAPKVGGLDVINRVARHYDLDDLGRPPPKSKRWCWGNTQISALGMVDFYARIKGDHRVGPWLLNAMHHFHDRSSGGDDQTFDGRRPIPAQRSSKVGATAAATTTGPRSIRPARSTTIGSPSRSCRTARPFTDVAGCQDRVRSSAGWRE